MPLLIKEGNMQKSYKRLAKKTGIKKIFFLVFIYFPIQLKNCLHEKCTHCRCRGCWIGKQYSFGIKRVSGDCF
ncbi:MAG TPA: hypothetical protein DCR42_01020 [Flavobacteriaceae bacterium]|nr:hypothetical protein [Flavobacteriaceae bacterium]